MPSRGVAGTAALWQSIQRLTQHRIVRSVAMVASGTAGAQAISLAFSPLLTRLYSPEAFGILGTFLAVFAVMAPLAALNFPMAMVLPSRDQEAICLGQLSIALGLLSACLIGLLLWGWGDGIVELIGLEPLAPYLFALPVAMSLSALLAVAMQWVIRKQRFAFKAKVAVAQSLLVNSMKAGLGAVMPLPGVLILITTLGSGVHAFLLFKRETSCATHSTLQPESIRVTLSTYRRLALQYKDVALFRTPQALLNAASQGLPVIMLAATFGAAAAGLYSLGRTVLEAPAKLVGHSVATVLYPRINEAAMGGEALAPLIFKATMALLGIGSVLFAGLIALGPELFGWIFGEQWRQAGSFAQWLALWTWISFAARPCVAAIPVLRLERFFLLHEVVSAVVRLSALYIGVMFWDSAIMAIALFSLANVLAYGVLIIRVLQGAKRFPTINPEIDR